MQTRRSPRPFAFLFFIAVLICTGSAAEVAAPTPAVLVLAASQAEITPPLLLMDGALSLPKGSPQGSGRAVFKLKIPAEGDYVLSGLVSAPSEAANSFLITFDSGPVSPGMIWDLSVSEDFAEQSVSWRGTWETDIPEWSPKVFHLTSGEHTLVLLGREPEAALRSFSLRRWEKPVAGSIADLRQRVDETENSFEHQIAQLPDTKEGQAKAHELWTAKDKACAELYNSAVLLAEKSPSSEEAFQALLWVLETPRNHYLAHGPKAFGLLTEHHAADPRILPLMQKLTRNFPYEGEISYDAAERLIGRASATNKDHAVLGCCASIRAERIKQSYLAAEYLGQEHDIARTSAAAIEAYESIIRNYADCHFSGWSFAGKNPSLADFAKLHLHEIQKLRIGMPAPEIDGADTSGAPLKLSEFRGKVVMLVFWASWCGPCMAAVPHEKEIVARFKNRPFVLLGVNGDNSLNDGAKAVAKNQIPWRSFWAAGKTIPRAWNVRAWPTVILIDHRGVIVKKNPFKETDAILEKLVAEAERP